MVEPIDMGGHIASGIGAATIGARAVARQADPVRVVVLSGVRLLREALAAALAAEPGLEIAGAVDPGAAPGWVEALRADVLLLDVTGRDGLASAAALRTALPATKIVALGVEEAEGAIMACAQAGVAGFVAPHASAGDVAAALRAAACGEFNCSPRTAALLLSRVSALTAAAARGTDAGENGGGDDGDPLTPREQEIAELMGDGLPNKQIARVLGIQTATVKNHVHSILTKLGFHRRGEVAARLRGRGVPIHFDRPRPVAAGPGI